MPDPEQTPTPVAAPPAAPAAPAAPVPAPAVPGRAAAPPAPTPSPEAPLPTIDADFSTYKRSESIAKLSAALATAQKTITNAVKDSTNPHFKGQYASLAAVRNACKDALSEAGIAVYQPCTAFGKRVSVTTLLVLGDEWIESTLHLNCGADTPQAAGGGLTYARRYGLAAMVGVAPEDDDGTEASKSLTPGIRQDAGKNSPIQAAAAQQPGNGGGTAAVSATPGVPAASPIPATAPSVAVVPPPVRPRPAPAPAPVPAAQQVAEINKAPASTVPPPPPGMKPPMKAPGS
jgi:hypothetical protein